MIFHRGVMRLGRLWDPLHECYLDVTGRAYVPLRHKTYKRQSDSGIFESDDKYRTKHLTVITKYRAYLTVR